MFASFPKTRLLLPCLLAVTLGPGALAQNPLPQTPTPPRRGPQNPQPAPAPAPTPAPTPAPQTPAPGTPAQTPGGRPGFPGGGFGQAARPAGPRPYADVITKDAKSDPGVFTVHRIDDRILFEIPAIS